MNRNSAVADDDEDEEGEYGDLVEQNDIKCTSAVTGSHAAFQSIFVCQTCCDSIRDDEWAENVASSCICAGCADVCHIDHEVVYIGMGPAYCDCANLLNSIANGNCCQLQEFSRQEADKLGITSPGSLFRTTAVKKPKVSSNDHQNDEPIEEETGNENYVMDIFQIPFFVKQPNYLRQQLVRQALELVLHTRDTHWVDRRDIFNQRHEWCELEKLAWKIFLRHVKYYQLFVNDDAEENKSNEIVGGAEWWVQVKYNKKNHKSSNDSEPLTAAATTASCTKAKPTSSYNDQDEAIDLHYDKDELLAEAFGLGSFPSLSTVTYLCGNPSLSTPAKAPTLILPHRYDQSETHTMSHMMVSHPRMGKHVVFDGRLLHGAPAHVALRKPNATPTTSTADETDLPDDDENGLRITFLVNIWLTGRPTGVQRLPDDIRAAIRKEDDLMTSWQDEEEEEDDALELVEAPIETIHLDRKAAESLNRIELPFVSKGATWIRDLDDGDDDVGGGIRLITFPPPHSSNEADTFLVHFGPGLQAYLERDDDDEVDDVVSPARSAPYQEFYV